MEELFDKYENVQLFLTKYRGYAAPKEGFFDFETFKNKMQVTGYIFHTVAPIGLRTLEAGDAAEIDVFMMAEQSPYVSSAPAFRRLLNRYKPKKRTVFVITKEKLNIHIKKSIKKSYAHLHIRNFLHMHFVMELNRGPMCGKHTILTDEEVRALCDDISSHGHMLPEIMLNDPQNIWIGGKVNDIIKIENVSGLTGNSIRYRIVVPNIVQVALDAVDVDGEEAEEADDDSEGEDEGDLDEFEAAGESFEE